MVQDRNLSRPEAVVALIPAFKPDRLLIALVGDLLAGGFRSIIVVDDGSPPEAAPVFDELAATPGCRLLRHEANRGKGRAVKTGFEYFLEHCPGAEGIVTVDADGQHRARDVVRVAEAFLAAPDALVIGSRKFARQTPWRSRFGNRLTSRVFRWVAGVRLGDTQSGLRCFSRAIVPRLRTVAGERYEYEMNVLVACPKLSVPLREVEIETVYLDGNRSSHFNPLFDSMKIYFLLLRFSLASLLAALVDFLVFAAAWRASGSVLAGMALARLVSASINFQVNRGPVFHSGDRSAWPPLKYAALVIALGTLAYFSIRALVAAGVPVLPAKLIAETTLFAASFAVQRGYVFTQRTEAAQKGPGARRTPA